MEELTAYRKELCLRLVDVMNTISEKTKDLTITSWQQRYNSISHTPHYILSHLQAVEVKLIDVALLSILNQPSPMIPAFDVESWMKTHYDPDEPAKAILKELVNLRNSEQAWLIELPSSGWSRSARHPWWGLHTLQWWVELQLDYSYQHLKEISSALEL